MTSEYASTLYAVRDEESDSKRDVHLVGAEAISNGQRRFRPQLNEDYDPATQSLQNETTIRDGPTVSCSPLEGEIAQSEFSRTQIDRLAQQRIDREAVDAAHVTIVKRGDEEEPEEVFWLCQSHNLVLLIAILVVIIVAVVVVVMLS